MRRITKRLRLGVMSIFAAILFVWASPQQTGAQQTVPTHIQSVYTAIADAADIPLLVPTTIPLSSPAELTEYWARGSSPNADRYHISFDRESDCTGVVECAFASVRGELDAESIYSYQQLLAQPRNEEVVLADGTRAVFSPHRGMGQYTPASLYILRGRYLYTFNIYMADKADVVAMANSATFAYDR